MAKGCGNRADVGEKRRCRRAVRSAVRREIVRVEVPCGHGARVRVEVPCGHGARVRVAMDSLRLFKK